MRTFKFFWTTHKWTGIILSAILATTAMTGFMLLVKKRVEWIQPSTLKGAEGEVAQFISMGDLYDTVLAQAHPDFAVPEDIDRVDVRPDKRLYKVLSAHHYAEMQVCAVTGEILGVSWRPSDLLENIHDGSFFGAWAHDWVMPVVSAALLFLVLSGLWLWIEPALYRRRRRRRERA